MRLRYYRQPPAVQTKAALVSSNTPGITLAQRPIYQGRLRRGVSGLSGAFIACCLFMVGTHLLHFSVGLAILRRFPFHVTYHACLALTWGTMLGFALYTCRVAATVDFRFVTGPAVAVYCIRWAGRGARGKGSAERGG